MHSPPKALRDLLNEDADTHKLLPELSNLKYMLIFCLRQNYHTIPK